MSGLGGSTLREPLYLDVPYDRAATGKNKLVCARNINQEGFNYRVPTFNKRQLYDSSIITLIKYIKASRVNPNKLLPIIKNPWATNVQNSFQTVSSFVLYGIRGNNCHFPQESFVGSNPIQGNYAVCSITPRGSGYSYQVKSVLCPRGR